MVDDYFNSKTKPESFQRLTEALVDWKPKAGYTTWKWFQVWEGSNWVSLPFSGAYAEQPTWVTEDFELYLAVKRWNELNNTLPTVEGLPKMDDAA